jgi:Flp pilus assembly pilin Flp
VLNLFRSRRRGQGYVEYGVIAAVVALVVMIGANNLSGAERAYFGGIGPSMAPTPPPSAPIGAATALIVPTVTGTYAGTVTLTATLKSGATGVSGEMLYFSLNGAAVCGGTTGVTCPTTDASGTATLSSVSLGAIAAGTYTTGIGVVFQGDTGYRMSTNTGTLIVSPTPTTIAVMSASSTYGGTVSLIATLSSGSVGLSNEPLSFNLNGTAVCTLGVTCPTTDANGIATLSNVSLGSIASGPYPSGITATFQGDTNYGASNGSGPLTVSPRSTAMLVDAKTVSSQGGNVTLTASVYPTGITPVPTVNTGSVTFSVSGACPTLPAVTVSSVGAASVSCNLTSNSGPFTIVANYTDSAGNFLASGGTAPMTVVASTATATNLVVSPARVSISGGSVTVTATLTDISNAGVKNKNITFNINGTAASAKTNPSGVATVTVTLPAKASNTYQITANWAGDGTADPSTATSELTVN